MLPSAELAVAVADLKPHAAVVAMIAAPPASAPSACLLDMLFIVEHLCIRLGKMGRGSPLHSAAQCPAHDSVR
jgi:hypothetical protein